MGDVYRQYNSSETTEDVGDFGILFPQHYMHQIFANHDSNHNNIDIDTNKAVRNIEEFDNDSI